MPNPLRDMSEWDVHPDDLERVRHYLAARVVPESTEDLRSPLFKGQSDEEILDSWSRETKSLAPLAPRLSQMESDNRDKFGPRSCAKSWEDRKSDVYAYFKDQGGRSLTMGEGDRPIYRPFDLSTTLANMKLNKSSGLPHFKKKRDVADVTVDDFDSLLASNYPCILGTRTQEKWKTRTVWMYPFADTILEQRYFQPLLEMRKRVEWRAALAGPEQVEKGVSILFGMKDGRQILSIDFSKFDASVQPRLSRPALWSLLSRFQNNGDVDTIIDRFVNIGLLTPDGVATGEHGVPSGSTFTNEVDSEVQYLIACECPSLRKGWASHTAQIQGDDGLYCTDDPEGVKAWFREYGLEVNDDKSDVAEDYAIFLQHYFGPEYRDSGLLRGVYSTTRAINRIIHLERWPEQGAVPAEDLSGHDYFAIRTVCILENCKHHPHHEELVKFVARNSGEGLGFSGEGLDIYIRRYKDQKGPGGRHQVEDVQSRSAFWNFKTLKVLASI